MTHVKITDACHVLFGREIAVSPDFIAYLQPDGLKSAYRQLALQTHPDRAQCLGVEPGAMARRFLAVQSAYETLKPYVMERQPLPPFRLAPVAASPTPARGHNRKREKRPASHAAAPARPAASAPAQADFFFTGSMPRTRLRLGQFLFYRQKVSWWTVVHAMVWQQRHRPRLGDLAQEYGWLNAREVQAVQQAAGAQELWGEAAIRSGALERAQILQLLDRQRQFGRPIGRYCVEQGMLGEVELDRLVVDQQRHNRVCAEGRPFKDFPAHCPASG